MVIYLLNVLLRGLIWLVVIYWIVEIWQHAHPAVALAVSMAVFGMCTRVCVAISEIMEE